MYYCKLCTYTTIRFSNLRRHVAVHQKIYVGHLKCSLCNYRSTRKQNVARHLIRKHSGNGVVVSGELQESDNPYSEATFVAKYQCNICNFSSTNKQEVINHQSTGHTDRAIVGTEQEEALKSHPDPNPDPLPDPYIEPSADPEPQHKIIFAANFQCSVCNYRNAKKENVIKHQYSKHGSEDDAMTEPDREKINNADLYSVSEKIPLKEEEDESEPAKRLLLAECGLIWHSDDFKKGECSIRDSDPSTTWMHS